MTILHNESLAVAHNLLDGFDMYKLEPYDTNNSRRPFHTLRHELGPNVPLPCLAVHGGFAVAGGSGVGRVRIWDIKTKQKFLSLRHEGMEIHSSVNALLTPSGLSAPSLGNPIIQAISVCTAPFEVESYLNQ